MVHRSIERIVEIIQLAKQHLAPPWSRRRETGPTVQLGITRQSYKEIGYVWLPRTKLKTHLCWLVSTWLSQTWIFLSNIIEYSRIFPHNDWIKFSNSRSISSGLRFRSGLLEDRKYVNKMYLFFLQEQQQQHERRRIRAPLRMLLNVSRIPALSNKFLLARYTYERFVCFHSVHRISLYSPNNPIRGTRLLHIRESLTAIFISRRRQQNNDKTPRIIVTRERIRILWRFG